MSTAHDELQRVCHALGIDITVEEPEAGGSPVVWFRRSRDADRFDDLTSDLDGARDWRWEYAPFPASLAFWMQWRRSVELDPAAVARVVTSLGEVVRSGG